MKFPLRSLPVLLILVLAACAPRVMVEHDSNVQFRNYHRFAWVAPPDKGTVQDPILDSQILEQRVKHAVESELSAQGYVETTPDDHPDFIVTYHTSRQQVQTGGSSFSLGIVDAFPYTFGGVIVPVNNSESHEEGTLMLDVIDGQSKRLAWRGWTTDSVNQDNYSEAAVAQAVQEILAKFPPG